MSTIRNLRAIAALFYLFGGSSPALSASHRLTGTDVAVQILTYNDKERPLYVSEAYHAVVKDGPEFGVGREAMPLYYSAVPVVVDVGNYEVEFSYRTSEFPSAFAVAKFNGYVLSFDGCLQFSNVRVASSDQIAMSDDRVADNGNRILINVSGLEYDRTSRFKVAFDVSSCAMSSAAQDVSCRAPRISESVVTAFQQDSLIASDAAGRSIGLSPDASGRGFFGRAGDTVVPLRQGIRLQGMDDVQKALKKRAGETTKEQAEKGCQQ